MFCCGKQAARVLASIPLITIRREKDTVRCQKSPSSLVRWKFPSDDGLDAFGRDGKRQHMRTIQKVTVAAKRGSLALWGPRSLLTRTVDPVAGTKCRD